MERESCHFDPSGRAANEGTKQLDKDTLGHICRGGGGAKGQRTDLIMDMDIRRLDNKMDMIMVNLVDTLFRWMDGWTDHCGRG